MGVAAVLLADGTRAAPEQFEFIPGCDQETALRVIYATIAHGFDPSTIRTSTNPCGFWVPACVLDLYEADLDKPAPPAPNCRYNSPCYTGRCVGDEPPPPVRDLRITLSAPIGGNHEYAEYPFDRGAFSLIVAEGMPSTPVPIEQLGSIDWGDGTVESPPTSLSHTYTAARDSVTITVTRADGTGYGQFGPVRLARAPQAGVAGAPGTWTPADAILAPLPSLFAWNVTAIPPTPWTSGQYIAAAYPPAAEVHWDGTTWVAGRAP